MKAILSLALVGILSGLCSAADLKIATIDVQRVLSDYYKSQEALRAIKLKEVSFLKELEGLRLEGRHLVEEVDNLQQLSTSNILSAAEREQKRKTFEQRVTDLNAFRVRYDDVRAQREAQLQAEFLQANQKVQADVLSVTRSIGNREGFNLILNASKTHPWSTDVIYSHDVLDLTDKVLASLNASKPNENGGDRK